MYLWSMTQDIQKQIAQFESQLTARRVGLLRGLAAQRSRHFTMVLEDLYDPHNISAVIRTSEVFGFQDVHIIEEENPFRIAKSILKGSFKWMNLFRYKQRASAMANLKAKGYRIAVASTNTDKTIDELDLSIPTAFYLGAEKRGNHPDTLEQADVHFILPQYGLTESMNVSVAAGCLMTHLEMFMRKEGRANFCLNQEEQDKILLEWYDRHVNGLENNNPLLDVPNLERIPNGGKS